MKLEDKQRLAQEEESEAKRLAMMMMKKREKYLYQKIMFGKRRKIREVGFCSLTRPLHICTVELTWPIWPRPVFFGVFCVWFGFTQLGIEAKASLFLESPHH